MLSLDLLALHPRSVELSLSLSPSRSTLPSSLAALASFHALPLSLSHVELHRLVAAPPAVARAVAASLCLDAVLQLPLALGSLDVFGSPTSLVTRSLAAVSAGGGGSWWGVPAGLGAGVATAVQLAGAGVAGSVHTLALFASSAPRPSPGEEGGHPRHLAFEGDSLPGRASTVEGEGAPLRGDTTLQTVARVSAVVAEQLRSTSVPASGECTCAGGARMKGVEIVHV